MTKRKYFSESENTIKFWESYYSGILSSPFFWGSESYNLKFSADYLYEEYSSVYNKIMKDEVTYKNASQVELVKLSFKKVSMMLYGYAFECLMKGICFTIKKESISDIFTHELVDLLKITNELLEDGQKLILNDEELYLFERLSTFARWAGKYPIPKKAKEFMPCQDIDGGFTPLSHIKFSDAELIENLYNKFSIVLKELSIKK